MTKRQATIGLLKHGALSLSEFKQITGWKPRKCRDILIELVQEGALIRPKRGTYQLAP